MSAWVESGCTVKHEGVEYTAGGAVIGAAEVVGYLGANGVLTDWHGNGIGTYRQTAKWRTPRSAVSSHMFQVEATVDGRKYTGRSAGLGMVYSGKAKR
jgi:hypothetical protein